MIAKKVRKLKLFYDLEKILCFLQQKIQTKRRTTQSSHSILRLVSRVTEVRINDCVFPKFGFGIYSIIDLAGFEGDPGVTAIFQGLLHPHPGSVVTFLKKKVPFCVVSRICGARFRLQLHIANCVSRRVGLLCPRLLLFRDLRMDELHPETKTQWFY